MSFRRALALAVLLAPVPAFAQFYPPIAMSDADALAEQVRRLGANPLDLDALLTAGELSVRLEDLSAAGAFFTRAEKIDPRNGRAKAGDGAILVRSERPGEALRYFTLAEQLGAPPARFASDRGLAYDLLGDPGRAQRDYKLALTARDDAETRRRYALSLGIVGRQAQALEQLAPLLRQNDRGAWRARAFILAMGGNAAEASRIAQTMMPPGAATGLASFFAELPRLPVVDRAFAVHFGEVRATPQRLADARVAPVQAPLALDPLPVRVAVAAPAPDKRDKRDRRRRGDSATAAPVQIAAVQPQPQPPAYQAPAYQAPAYRPPTYQAPYRVPSYRPPAYASTRTATGDRPLTPGEQASLAAAGGRMSSSRSSRRSQASMSPYATPDATRALSAAQRANMAVATGRPPTPAPQPVVLAAATPVRVPTPVQVLAPVPVPARREPVVVASAPTSPYAFAGTTGAGATGPRPGVSLATVVPVPPTAIVATETPALAARTVAPAPTPTTIAPPASLSTTSPVIAPTVTVPNTALAATVRNPALVPNVPSTAVAPTGIAPNTALATATSSPTPIAGPTPGFTTALTTPFAGPVAAPGLNVTAPVALGQAELAANAPFSPLAVAPPVSGSGDVAALIGALPAAPTAAAPAPPIAQQQQVALATPNLSNAPLALPTPGAPVAGPPAPEPVIAAETTPAPNDAAIAAPISAVPPPAAAVSPPIEAPAALVTPVAADRPTPRRPRLAGEADSILAKIVAGLSIPASELDIDGPTRALPGAGKRLTLADRKALAAKTSAPKTLADEKPAADKESGAKKNATDKKALAAKKEAAAKKAADDKEAADAKAIERVQPARIWVQVAGGADEAALTKAWRTARTKAATAMAGRQGYTTPLRATNRVLTGPFKTDAEARAYVNQLAKAGVSAFTFTSDKGQKITKLDEK